MDLNARKQRLMKEMGTSLERAKSRLKHDELTLRFYDPKSQLNEKKNGWRTRKIHFTSDRRAAAGDGT